MIPTNSSNTTNGCDSISSNCVIWQGPDISCINLCHGDTISDVVAKLAELLCSLIEDGITSNPNLTGLDLTCLNVPGTTPTTLVPVLQAMITAICDKSAPAGPTPEYIQANLPMMTLPACLVYDDASGNPVTQLRLDNFALLLANKICEILSAIVYINTTLTNFNTRITVLEACVLPCTGATAETQVIPTCIINVGVLTDVSVLLLALEARFCALETAVGLPAAINEAIGQAEIYGTSPTLSDSSVSYGSIPGWNNTPTNLAESTQNIWVVLNDLYSAVSDIQTNCCPTGCDGVSFGYNTLNVINGDGTLGGINFNFQNTSGNGCVIPATFNDCAGSTVITITDSNGVTITSTVSVSALQNSATGVTISLPGLNTYTALTTSVAFCVTNGSDTCNNTIVKTVQGIIPCPTPVVTEITSTGATVTFTNTLGASAVYVIDILNSTTNLVVATYTQNAPGPTVTHAFTGLVAGTAYKVRVTVQMGGVNQVCTKAGIPSTVTTIQAASGTNDYRLALVLADESSQTIPTYNTSVNYVALPAAQKVINTGAGGGAPRYQFITAVEKFATNNNASFTTQLNKIDTGAAPLNWPIGQGAGTPEPTDMALGLCIEGLNFAGAFRTNVAKYVLIYTDAPPSGDDDIFTATDITRLNTLAQTCLLQGIKCFVLGVGVNYTYTPPGGTASYPWRVFADATNGAWNESYSTATVNSLITNGCAT